MEKSDILDSFKLKDNLNDRFWNNMKFNKEANESLMNIANDFLTYLGLDVDVEDVRITGSIANYNWSKFSDIDLHILVDFDSISKDTTLVTEFFQAKERLWNLQHDVSVFGYAVEIYVQDDEEPHKSTGVYSLLYNKWITQPDKLTKNIDVDKIYEKASAYMEIIDDVIANKDEDKKSTVDAVKKVMDKIKQFRQCGLDEGGEFSYENLAFKYLRRNGYIGKLLDFKNEVIDNTLTVETEITENYPDQDLIKKKIYNKIVNNYYMYPHGLACGFKDKHTGKWFSTEYNFKDHLLEYFGEKYTYTLKTVINEISDICSKYNSANYFKYNYIRDKLYIEIVNNIPKFKILEPQ